MIARLEFVKGLALIGLDHVGDKLFGVRIQHPGAGVIVDQLVPYGLQQVCLAQPHTAIDEQRVVELARRIGHMHGCCARHAVGAAFHQRGECAAWVQPGIAAGVGDCRNGDGPDHRFSRILPGRNDAGLCGG